MYSFILFISVVLEPRVLHEIILLSYTASSDNSSYLIWAYKSQVPSLSVIASLWPRRPGTLIYTQKYLIGQSLANQVFFIIIIFIYFILFCFTTGHSM